VNAIQRKRVRTVVTFAVVGALGGSVLGLIIGQIDQRILLWSGVRGLSVGVLIGVAVGVGEEFLLPRWSRRFRFFTLNTLRVLMYSAVMLLALVLVNGIAIAIGSRVRFIEGARRYLFDDPLTRDFLMSLVTVVILTSVLEIRTLHNRGEMWRFLTGRYRYPEEEVRLFLFADMVGSTALAERLGNLAFSSLVRECLSDTSEAILAWGGDVYQFMGDGVIVTWRQDPGLKDAACIRCFFEMVGMLEARADKYMERYGVVPRLRGGVHGGDVITTWVGEAKKELTFHGDALNAASRIEALCKETGADCLASQWVLDRLELPGELNATAIGDVRLRGKREPIALCAIEHSPDAGTTTSVTA
jgi:adenylate cyclase